LEKKLLATSLIIKVCVKRNKDERKELKGTASLLVRPLLTIVAEVGDIERVVY